LALVEGFITDAKARGEGLALGFAGQAVALLYNGLGRDEDAFAAVRAAVDVAPYSQLSTPSAVAELVEAAARAGERRIAERALERLTVSTQPSGTRLGVERLAECEACSSSLLLCRSRAYENGVRTRWRSGRSDRVQISGRAATIV
jgi:hypothetical protein